MKYLLAAMFSRLDHIDSMNIQFNWGFRGCMEYPRTSLKHILKEKFVEAPMVI